MGTASSAPESVGPYRIETLIGKGGMGAVYRAYDDRLARRVAIKHIRPDREVDAEARGRLRQEARAAAALAHPAIIQIFDILEQDGDDWIVMELIEGPTLAKMLRDGPLETPLALDLAREIADGLAFAHANGIVHRDLKAENVMLSALGQAKILDFGLAKQLLTTRDVSGTLTVDGSVLGTCRSMSPEQARGQAVDARSDLFSFGVLLYESLTATSPFKVASSARTLARVCTFQQEPAHALNPEVPAALSKLADQLLEKLPERRPPGARHVAERLAEIAEALDRDSDAEDSAGKSIETEETLIQPPTSAVIRTLLLTDLVGSTRLFETLGDQRALEVSSRHDRLARNLLQPYGGLEIDKTDGFLLLFERPIDAVGYALAYHAKLARLAEKLDIRLEARAGIHLGEVFLRRNPPEEIERGAKPLEVEGLAKPMAARLMSLATGGQTLLTRGAFDLANRAAVGDETQGADLCWLSHGDYVLKGVEEPVTVFEVGVEGRAPMSAPEGSEKVRRPDLGSPTSAAPRDTAPPADGTGDSSAATGQEPGSTTMPASSRPAARLPVIRTAAIVLAVLTLVIFALPGPRDTVSRWLRGERPSSATLDVSGRSPHDLFVEGQELLRHGYRSDNPQKALDLFDAALEKDSDHAPSHAGVSLALIWLRSRNRDPLLIDRAFEEATHAVELNPHLALAHQALGVSLFLRGQYDEAALELEEALRLDPLFADAHRELGNVFAAQKQMAKAEQSYERAKSLNPDEWLAQERLALLYVHQERFDEAETAFERLIGMVPDNPWPHNTLAGLYFNQGRYEESSAELQKSLQIEPHHRTYSVLGAREFYLGRYREATEAFSKAVELGAGDYLNWGNLADAYRWTPGKRKQSEEAYLQAIRLAREKLETAPEDVTLLSRIAVYLAKRGQTEEALEKIAALDLSGERDPNLRYRAAQIYEISGLREEALPHLEAAIAAGKSVSEIRREPEWTELRKDPRFHLLVTPAATSARKVGDSRPH